MTSTFPPPSQHASSSTPPLQLNHLSPKPNGETSTPPVELPPYERIDLDVVKQELHDALGENGLPYWKALNGFLLGQLRRDELVGMVRRWLKGTHRKLLLRDQCWSSFLTLQFNCTTDCCWVCCTTLPSPQYLPNRPACRISINDGN